jgi:hypothetical protein
MTAEAKRIPSRKHVSSLKTAAESLLRFPEWAMPEGGNSWKKKRYRIRQ